MDVNKVLEYHEDIQQLIKLLTVNKVKFDCILALKRSGWILGACLSNHFDIPVFTESEIKSIPIEKFNSILIVDDKVCTGHSFMKARNKLLKKCINFDIKTAVLYVEGDKLSSNIKLQYSVKKLKTSEKMYYE